MSSLLLRLAFKQILNTPGDSFGQYDHQYSNGRYLDLFIKRTSNKIDLIINIHDDERIAVVTDTMYGVTEIPNQRIAEISDDLCCKWHDW